MMSAVFLLLLLYFFTSIFIILSKESISLLITYFIIDLLYSNFHFEN